MAVGLTGCASLKERTGEYITEAVVEKLTKDLDVRLATKNLSTAELKKAADVDGNGSVTTSEVITSVKGLAKDFMTIEAQKLVNEKLDEFSKKVVTTSDLNSSHKEMLNYLIMTIGGLVSAYLGKQVVSAKNDGKRDARISVLEKFVGKDIDGDGKIGSSQENSAT